MAPSFGVPGSVEGTLFQIRYALLLLVQSALTDPTVSMRIERLDDIEVVRVGGRELVQAKHHQQLTQVSDFSRDLWKTLRVWCELVKSDRTLLTNGLFTLITTGTCTEGSAVAMLASDGKHSLSTARSVSNELATIAKTSTNQENKKGYKAFLDLTAADRESLLYHVRVVDSSVADTGIADSLCNLLSTTVTGESQVRALVQMLEGWWSNRVVQHLKGLDDWLSGSEVLRQIREIADSLGPQTLPVSDEILAMALPKTIDESPIYVKQLRLVACGDNVILHAILDFIRAGRQIAEWMREDLILINELSQYKRKLTDEWMVRFQFLLDELDGLGESAAVEVAAKRGQQLYQSISQLTLPIRSLFSEGFVMRGTYHDLADCLDVGWHPKYKDKL